jgi:3-hydroxyisobutyrate dehydrogenase-like beta-hydroxyacid dehydrogenase
MAVKLGFIGLGRMGQSMVDRLLSAGCNVAVYNRTAEKLQPLVARGARVAATIAEAARYAGVVLTMVSDDAALVAVTEGDGGLIEALPTGGVHIVMGTHSVGAIRSLAAAHTRGGQILLTAPVLGRPEAVTAGRLGVIVAGEPSAVERCLPILSALGRRVFRAGTDPGSAAAMKLANNCLLACAIEALGEAFSLVEKCGADRGVFRELITDGMFACPAYDTYARIIADKAWDQVGFTVALALKDIELGLAAGATAGVPLPSAQVCRERLLGAISHGDQRRDWAAMALEQARASGLA